MAISRFRYDRESNFFQGNYSHNSNLVKHWRKTRLSLEKIFEAIDDATGYVDKLTCSITEDIQKLVDRKLTLPCLSPERAARKARDSPV